MRRFVVVGRTASADPDFLLDDFPGTSGRLDALVRCIRSALLVSHGVRRDATIDLVLQGGGRGTREVRTLRFVGQDARFLRPDERTLAVLVKKILTRLSAIVYATPGRAGFAEVQPGIFAARVGLEASLDLQGAALYVLEEGAKDVRDVEIPPGDAVFVLGDHLGFDDAARALLAARGAIPIGLGPVSLHAEDAIAVLSNELDRRA